MTHRDATAEIERAMDLLADGQWEDGFRLYEARFAYSPGTYRHAPRGIPGWEGDSLEDRQIALIAEQGAGDTLMFARYIAWVRSLRPDRLMLHVSPRLRPLFALHPDIDDLVPWGLPVRADCYAFLGSLPYLHGTTPRNVPPPEAHYRHAAAELLPFTLPRAAGSPRVGLCWAGNPGHVRDRERSIMLEELLALTGPGLALYSLQVGDRAGDIVLADAPVVDLSGALTGWRETAAAILSLDAVVSVDTGVAHLAGSLGIPTALLVAREADWRWLRDRTDTPWYPAVRIFRQDAAGWQSIAAPLRRWLAGCNIERAA